MVMINAGLLFFYSDAIQHPWDTLSFYVNVLFIILFCVEMIVKLLVLGPNSSFLSFP